MKRMAARSAATASARQVTSWAPRSPIQRPKNPARNAPTSGRKMAATVTALPLHEVDVFDGDAAAVAEIDDEDGEADRRLGGGDGQHEHGEDLSDEVVQKGREGDEVDVDGEQHELDRHEDDDDVLPVEKDAEDADREQDCGHGQIVGKPDDHARRLPIELDS